MRKSLKEALKWLNMKTEVADKQGSDLKRINEKINLDKSKSSGHNKKVMEILVKRCINLKRADG